MFHESIYSLGIMMDKYVARIRADNDICFSCYDNSTEMSSATVPISTGVAGSTLAPRVLM